MKTVQQLQEEVYHQALSSGFFKSQQAQLKSYVYDVPPLSPRSLKRSMGLRPKDFNTNILFSPN
jgi:hypothetical protein